jgi:Big-like domain-containing protein
MMQPKTIGRKSMQVRLVSAIAMTAVLGLLAVACGSSTSPSTVSTVAITGTPPLVGATSQFLAIATLSDGTTLDVTSVSTWVSSNTAEATVSSAGLVTGVGAGTVTVQATYQSITGSDQITLTQ